ncbi:peroxisomal membrane protein PEX16 [Dendroctonus ponderosae]
MSSLLLSLPELFNSYKTWVSKNPQIASDYESTAKWISYFLAGRINNSHLVSELVYCLSNLLVLFNDGVIKQSMQLKSTATVEKIKVWLAIVEYSEVFCELSVQKLWGNTGKWILIVAIQVFKCIARLLLIYKHNETIVENPTIAPLDRGNIAKCQKGGSKHLLGIGQSEFDSVSFTLKRSGRVVRKVESSPPIGLRNWKPVELQAQKLPTDFTEQQNGASISKRQLIAETLYVTKPLIHLASMGVFGKTTWKPWVISLAIDLTSLQLYKSTQQTKTSLSKKQQLQLSKRTMLLLLYLLRSPFYEKHSGDKLDAFLIALSNNLPLAKLICTPLMQYLPFWQSNYFYMWSS